MDERKIRRLGRTGYTRSVEPLKRDRVWRSPIIGFDTEYTSDTRELICFQLWHGDSGALIPVKKGEKLTPRWIYEECIRLVGYQTDFLLVTYFSLAELQFLPVVSEGIEIREYGSGSLDVAFLVGHDKLHIFDLQRWFASPNQPLEKAAASFGLEKLDFDTRHVKRSDMRSDRFRRYALNDARIQHDIAVKLRDIFMEYASVDPLIAKTPASASAMSLRRMFVKKKLYCDDNRARLLAMRGTWGGHAEVFQRGNLPGKWQEWDLKSAYPSSAIALGEMPIQQSWRAFKTLRAARKMRGGFARARFRWPRNERYPSLPVCTHDCMLYPLEGETVCTLEELREAADNGCEIKIVDGKGYTKGTTALSDYLQWTLEERAQCTEKADEAKKHMWKLLGNSLIGKFAQNIHKVSTRQAIEIALALDLCIDEVFELNKEELSALAQVAGLPDPVRVSVGPVFMPEWNGLITGYTRAALAEMIRSGEAVYCHTDSVWCQRKPTCMRLKYDLKTEGKVTIIRTRFAAMGNRITYQTVKDGNAHVAHHSIWNLTAGCQILSKFRSNGGVDFRRKYPIKRPLKLKESIKRGKTPGEWVTEYRWGDTKWDAKRVLLDDGNTRPYLDTDEFVDTLRSMT